MALSTEHKVGWQVAFENKVTAPRQSSLLHTGGTMMPQPPITLL